MTKQSKKKNERERIMKQAGSATPFLYTGFGPISYQMERGARYL